MLIAQTAIFIISLSICCYKIIGLFINQYYSISRMNLYFIQKLKAYKNEKKLMIKGIILFFFCVTAIFSFPFAEIFLLISFSILAFFNNSLKIKYTRRSISLMVIAFLLIAGFSSVHFFYLPAAYIIVFLLILMPNIILYLAFYIAYPMEKTIRKYYMNRAKRKLKLNPQLKIIAITGSYGKTSFKSYLHTLLSKKYSTIKSPASVNTVMGLCKFINGDLSPYDDILILEFGVDTKGGMDKLLNFIKPNYGVITAVGAMHLATFKTIENIRLEKTKLARGLIGEKVLFYSRDSVEFKNNELDDCQAISYSLDEVEIKKVSPKGTIISIEKGKEITIPLLGRHQILNCIGAIKVAKFLGMSFEEITRVLPLITPEEHRLSMSKSDDMIIIDDSYNSNKDGMIEAINVIGTFKGVKAIITPGIIELGEFGDKINFQIGTQLSNFDYIFIVTPSKNHPLIKGYESISSHKAVVNIAADFISAYKKVKELNVDFLLICNDAHKIHLK